MSKILIENEATGKFSAVGYLKKIWNNPINPDGSPKPPFDNTHRLNWVLTAKDGSGEEITVSFGEVKYNNPKYQDVQIKNQDGTYTTIKEGMLVAFQDVKVGGYVDKTGKERTTYNVKKKDLILRDVNINQDIASKTPQNASKSPNTSGSKVSNGVSPLKVYGEIKAIEGTVLTVDNSGTPAKVVVTEEILKHEHVVVNGRIACMIGEGGVVVGETKHYPPLGYKKEEYKPKSKKDDTPVKVGHALNCLIKTEEIKSIADFQKIKQFLAEVEPFRESVRARYPSMDDNGFGARMGQSISIARDLGLPLSEVPAIFDAIANLVEDIKNGKDSEEVTKKDKPATLTKPKNEAKTEVGEEVPEDTPTVDDFEDLDIPF